VLSTKKKRKTKGHLIAGKCPPGQERGEKKKKAKIESCDRIGEGGGGRKGNVFYGPKKRSRKERGGGFVI